MTIEDIKITESLNTCGILYFVDIPCAECFGQYSNMDMFRDMSEDSDNVLFDGIHLHRALKYAVKTDLLPTNLADKIDRPKKNVFLPSIYDKNEINRLFDCVLGNHQRHFLLTVA